MKRRLRLYIDTSVLGSLFDSEDQRRVEIARGLIREIKEGKVEAFLSPLLLEEISKAPVNVRGSLMEIVRELQLPLLSETEESIHLAQDYIQEGVAPEKFRDDARHIAIAVFYELDGLLSWNYKHMVNLRVKRIVNAVNLKEGYKPIEILSPEEVVSYGEMDL